MIDSEMELFDENAAGDNLQGFEQRLEADLLGKGASRGLWPEGRMLSSPDIEDRYDVLAPGYYADAIGEFNAYPEVVLAWAAFMGIAAAFLWDKDLEAFSLAGYSYYRGEKGFDYMDEHILHEIIGLGVDGEEASSLIEDVRYLAGHSYSFLLHDGIEPGTKAAYRAVLSAIHVMYRLGAALMLSRLGYRMEGMVV